MFLFPEYFLLSSSFANFQNICETSIFGHVFFVCSVDGSANLHFTEKMRRLQLKEKSKGTGDEKVLNTFARNEVRSPAPQTYWKNFVFKFLN